MTAPAPHDRDEWLLLPVYTLIPRRGPRGSVANRLRPRISALLRRLAALTADVNARRALAFWLTMTAAAALDAWQGAGELRIQGAFISLVITGVIAAIGWIADKAVTVAITIAQAAAMIGIAIAQFAKLVAIWFVKGFDFLGRFWRQVLRPFVNWTWEQIDTLARWLQETLAPVIRFIEDVRKWIDDFYRTYIQPIYDAIEIVRRILGILEQFGIDLAARLDRALAELEDRLLQPIREIRGYLNEALNWINRIVTLDGLLQRVMLLRSLIRDAGLVFSAFHQTRHATVTDQDRENIRTGGGAATPEVVARALRQYYATEDGPLAEYVEMGIDTARRGLRTF